MARIKKIGNHVTVTNEFIRSKEISFKAKGVFVYMASFSDDWNFTIKSMATLSKDGYDSIKSSISELKELGYIRYEKHQDGTGTYYLTEDPKTGFPCVDNPIKGNSTPIKKTILSKKNNTYSTPNEKEEEPSDNQEEKPFTFMLTKKAQYDNLSQEYKDNLKKSINEFNQMITNKCIAANAKVPVLIDFEDFTLQLQSQGYLYKNFLAAFKTWHRGNIAKAQLNGK